MAINQCKALEVATQMSCPQYNVRTELQALSVDQIRSKQQALTADFGICCMNIRGEGNIGMIVRSACLMGASQMIICGRRKYDKRFTVGSDNYLDIIHWGDVLNVTIDPVPPEFVATSDYDADMFIAKLREAKWRPVFVEQGGEDLQTTDVLADPHNLYIMGNESTGIPDHFIKSVKSALPETRVLSIPQWSVLRSMNVSAAASIILWEARKRLNEVAQRS
jgi:tRNA G18 (ribose-2'-O)-methylase SpoU